MVCRLAILSERKIRPNSFETRLLSFLQSFRSAYSEQSAHEVRFLPAAHFLTKHLECIGLGLWQPLHFRRVKAPHIEQTRPQQASSKESFPFSIERNPSKNRAMLSGMGLGVKSIVGVLGGHYCAIVIGYIGFAAENTPD
jgi:hypothetical protein